MLLGELLIDAGLIDHGQLRAALALQREGGIPLGKALVQQGLLDDDTLVKLLSSQLHLPVANPDALSLEDAALRKLDATFCQRNGCIPLRLDPRGDRLDVAFADPTVSELVDLISVKSRCAVQPYIAAPSAIDRAIRQAYLGESTPHAASSDRPRRPATGPLPRRRPPEQAGDARLGTAGAARAGSGSNAGTLDDWPVAPNARSLTGPFPSLASIKPALVDLAEHQTEIVATREELAALREQVVALRKESSELRGLLERDERVLQRLLGLLVDRGICDRETLLAHIYDSD